MGEAGPLGRVPLEALILAFSHSRAKELVGTDALRSVLSGQYREIQRDGGFDLEPVWQLLCNQPGFDPEDVCPPLCRFKAWEKELRLEVRLPAAMAGLSDAARAELAAQVQVPAILRTRVLKGARVPSDDPDVAAADAIAQSEERTRPGVARVPYSVPPTIRTRRLRRLSRAQRRALEIAAAVLALFGFGLAGIQLKHGCRTEEWESTPIRFAGDIPLDGAKRQGPEVSGALRDSRWLALPASVRTAHMKAALEGLPRDVQVFFVRDGQGQIRAVARWFGQTRQIAVTFQ